MKSRKICQEFVIPTQHGTVKMDSKSSTNPSGSGEGIFRYKWMEIIVSSTKSRNVRFGMIFKICNILIVKGAQLTVKSKLTGQWINKMELKTNRRGIPSGHSIKGLYADIWKGLQVSINSRLSMILISTTMYYSF